MRLSRCRGTRARLICRHRSSGSNHLGLVQPDDGLGHGVVRIANTLHRRLDAGFGQPPDVVEAFLDELRERDENAIIHVEELTETSGIELLGELLRDTGDGNGRQTYERAMRRKLDAIRAENAVPADSDTPALDAALATLDERTIAHELGIGATAEYATRVARAEHEAGLEIVSRWRRRPKGRDAIIELVATLENDHPEEVENATRTSRGGPGNDLVAILGDETTRELYERLVTRLAAAKTDPVK